MNSNAESDHHSGEVLGMAHGWVESARRVTVLTGAGLSTDSGIPDFRGPNGVWTRNPMAERMATLQHYLADPEVRRLAWRSRLDNPAWRAEPNAGHRAIAGLHRQSKLRSVITQNVDGLHEDSGVPPEMIHEVHGTMRVAVCWSCGVKRPMRELLDRVRLGEDDPPCLDCGGIVKSDTILFGQQLVAEVIDAAFAAAQDCDVFVAVGSTLSVYPVAGCVPRAREAGAKIIIVNGTPTELDGIADAVLRGSISELLPMLC